MATLQPAGYPLFYQPITLVSSNGTNSTIRLHDIDEYQLARLETASGYSAQIGMCAVVLFVLLITTKLERLRTPLYIMNVLSLVVAILDSILRHVYWISTWGSIYVGLTKDYSVIGGGGWALLKTSTFTHVLLLALIEVALILQCRSVFAPYQSTRNVMTLVSSVIAIGVLVVEIWITIVTFDPYGVHTVWVPRANHIAFAFSLCFFSSIFLAKLWKSIITRKRLGFKQFSPISIAFIGGCQTLLIPVICTVTGIVLSGHGLIHSSRVIVVANLPLSAIWATAQSHMNNNAPSSFVTSLFYSQAQRESSVYSGGKQCNNAPDQRTAYQTADYPSEKDDRFTSNYKF